MIKKVKDIYQDWDQYHMKHLIKKLENWRAAAWKKLNERKASVKQMANKKNWALKEECLIAVEDSLKIDGGAIVLSMKESAKKLLAQMREWTQKVHDEYAKSADEQLSYMTTTLDNALDKWNTFVNKSQKHNGYIVLLD